VKVVQACGVVGIAAAALHFNTVLLRVHVLDKYAEAPVPSCSPANAVCCQSS
jgi:hypothetical protein